MVGIFSSLLYFTENNLRGYFSNFMIFTENSIGAGAYRPVARGLCSPRRDKPLRPNGPILPERFES